jgi:PAT family beta-lactamase induction signal transducer AmpG
LLRLTEKRFSATQYALFSSLFALPRVVAGPITGFAVNAVGWPAFFLSTMVLGIPGLLMLARFVRPGVREPDLDVGTVAAPSGSVPAVRPALIVSRIAAGMLLLLVGCGGVVALLSALAAQQENPAAGFDVVAAFSRVWQPVAIAGWIQLLGIVVCAIIGGLLIGARYGTTNLRS